MSNSQCVSSPRLVGVVVALAFATMCLIVIARPASAQTWTAAVSTNWNTAGNWNPATVPNSSAADVIFGPTGAGLVNIATSVQAQTLTFDSVAGGAYTLTSSANQTLTGVTNISVTGTISNVQTINLANVATGSLLVPGSGASALTIDNQAPVTSSSSPRLVIGPNTVIARTGAGSPGISFTGTGTTQVSGTIGASITGGLFLGGPGTLVITGTVLASGTDLTGGTLIADNSVLSASKLPSGNLTMRGSTFVMIAHPSTNHNETVGVLNLTAGHNVISMQTNNGASATLSLTMSSINRVAGSTADFSVETGGTITTTTGTVNGILGGYATAAGGDTWATKSGTAIVGLADASYGADTYSSGTNTDVVQINNSFASPFTTNSLRFTHFGQTLDISAGTNTLQSGGILVAPSATDVTISGGTLATPGEMIVHAYNSGDDTLITAAISAPGGLTKGGPAQLTLGGSTSGIGGPVNVNQGSIRFTKTTSLSALATINFNETRGSTAQDLSVEFGDGVSASTATAIRLNATTTSFDSLSPNSRVTLSGVISSAPGTTRTLQIFGDATSGFNLTGTNTFTGNIKLVTGFLGIDADASLGNAANTLNLSGGVLEFLNSTITIARPVNVSGNTRVISSATDVNTISGVMSGTASLTKLGTGTLVLSGTNTWTGQLLVDGGTVRVATPANLGTGTSMSLGGTLAVTDNISLSRQVQLGLTDAGPSSGTFDVAAGKTLTLTGSVANRSGAASELIKTGPGTLVLSSTGSGYTGGTTVQQGTVLAAGNASLGAATSPVTVEALGNLSFSGSTSTARPFNLTAGSLTIAAGQTLTFNGAMVGGGFLRGPGTFALTGGSSLIGSNTASGAVINQTGAASVANFTNNAQFTNAAGQTLTWSNGTNSSAGRLTVSGTANVSEFVSDGTITINPGGSINNSLFPMVLGGGSTTMLGSSGSPGGTIALGGQSLELRGGLLANFGTISGGTLNIYFGGLAAGTGAFPTVVLHPGGAFTPGVTLANVPVPAPSGPTGAAAISPLDPNQSTGALVLLDANTLATVNTADGTLTFTSPLNGPGKTLTKVGGGTLAVASLRAGGLAVNDGTVKILPNGGSTGTSTLNALSIASGGRLDLTNNKLIVSGGDIGAIAGLVKSGYHGGAWDGPGVMTSAATPSTGLGVALADEIGYVGRSFGGVTAGAGDVLMAYTLAADANLDGAVDFNDLVKLAQNYNTTGTSWPRGDFNFDGVTDFNDLVKLAQNYNTALPLGAAIAGAPAGFEKDLGAAFAQVPEPESGPVALALLIAGLASGRRRMAKIDKR